MKLKKILGNVLANILGNNFFVSFKLVKLNPGKTGLIILFDILFAISIFLFMQLSKYFLNVILNPLINAPKNFALVIIIVLSFVYYSLILLIYSFFKYCILDYIKSLVSKTKISFNRLLHFYLLNMIITGIFIVLFFLVSFVLSGIKQIYRPYILIFIAIPYFLLLYLLINISHSLFYKGTSIKITIKESFRIIFTKLKNYSSIISFIIVSVIILSFLFWGTGYLISLLADRHYSLYLSLYSYFNKATIIVIYFVFYFINFINRISFYNMVGNMIKIKKE